MFHMALSRATVTVSGPEGTTVHKEVTATVRDGVAKARKFGQDVATMPAKELTRHTGKHFTVVGPDGLTWDVLRDCGCGGRRA